jgi:glycosyltransferase involved in cell wall biosynthesis
MSLEEPDTTVSSIETHFPELKAYCVPVFLHPRSRPAVLGKSHRMIAAVRAEISEIDVIHVHGIWEGCLADLHQLAKSANVPFFVSAHGMLDSWSMKQSRAKKWLAMSLLGAGKILSEASSIIYGTEDELSEGSVVAPAHGTVVPNGIQTASLTRANLPEDTQLIEAFPQICQWSRTLLFFSRIHPKKGVDMLVDAFLSVAQKDSGVGLLIVGIAVDEVYETQLRARIAMSPLSDQIVLTTSFTGPAARSAFRHADVLVLPSHQEGFSMAILEAMALETPVVITNCCHFPEVEGLWQCGVVVDDTVAGITAGLEQVLATSDAELRAMGARAREAIVENFGWDKIAGRLETVYQTKLATP